MRSARHVQALPSDTEAATWIFGKAEDERREEYAKEEKGKGQSFTVTLRGWLHLFSLKGQVDKCRTVGSTKEICLGFVKRFYLSHKDILHYSEIGSTM